MNREILFRGKRNDNGEWVEGFYVLCRGHHYILQSCDTDHDFDERYCDWIEIDLETLCQYTGLPDKNGKKIFEGDILTCVSNWDIAKMYVVFEKGEFRIVLCENYKKHECGNGHYSIACFKQTVIGNIFDNPELIGEK